MDRLREDLRRLQEEYSRGLPMRACSRPSRSSSHAKLEAHPREPMYRVHLAYLARLVEGAPGGAGGMGDTRRAGYKGVARG